LLAKVLRPFDVFAAERLLCRKLIVSPAPNAKVLGVITAAGRPRLDVVELEESSRLATATVR
jgi:hypothetical protein